MLGSLTSPAVAANDALLLDSESEKNKHGDILPCSFSLSSIVRWSDRLFTG
jgi:hypothetical protein